MIRLKNVILSLGIVAILLSFNSCSSNSDSEGTKTTSSNFVETFKNADQENGPWVRWLLASDDCAKEELRAEVKALADAGFAGAEVGPEARGLGFGTEKWNQQIYWIMEAADEYGLQLDFFFTVGTISMPYGTTNVDDDEIEKKLIYKYEKVTLGSGESQAQFTVKAPDYDESTVVSARLVGISYAEMTSKEGDNVNLNVDNIGIIYEDTSLNDKFTSESTTTLAGLFNVSSPSELSGYITESGKFNSSIDENQLTAYASLPENTTGKDQTYYVFYYWEIPSGKTFGFEEGVGCYSIDHLSADAMQAVINVYEKYFDQIDGTRDLLRKVARAWFGDSIELNGNGWTRDMLDEFYAQEGYDFLPYLISVATSPTGKSGFGMGMGGGEGGHGENPEGGEGGPGGGGGMGGEGAMGSTPPFAMGNSNADNTTFSFDGCNDQVQSTYYSTATQCFINNHIGVLSDWASQYDMTVDYQSTYGYSYVYGLEASLHIDIPESESLQFNDCLDGYRSQAGALHMGNNSGLYSIETSPCQGDFANELMQTLTWYEWLWHCNRFYSVGGNQVKYHVYAYATDVNNDSEYFKSMNTAPEVWPGFFPQPNVGDNLKRSYPSFAYLNNFTDAVSRTQTILRTGEAKVDVAIYEHDKVSDKSKFGTFYNDDNLDKLGYSYEFIDPSFLELDNAVISNRVLDEDGPAYKAIIFNNQKDMVIDAASKLLSYAEAGYPMIFIGDLPTLATDFAGSCDNQAEANSQLKEIVDDIAECKNVKQVATTADVPETLMSMGISAASSYSSSTDLITARRVDDDVDYYFMLSESKYFDMAGGFQPEDSYASTTVTFAVSDSNARPYILDLWTGDISPAASYIVNGDGTISMDIALKGHDTMALVFASDDWYTGSETLSDVYVEKSAGDVDYHYDESGNIMIRTTSGGKYSTVLSNGKTVDKIFPEVEEPYELTDWNLKLISYGPGTENTYDVVKTEVYNGKIGKAVSFNVIDAIQDAKDLSGVGYYSTEIEWDSSLADGAYLDLGKVYDLYTLYVNDQEVYGADIVDTTIDIGDYLVDGTNTIRVEVASNLYNAAHANGAVQGTNRDWIPTQFGITNGVSLIPYKEDSL